MQTHLGAGAGQGLEDVYLLAQLLNHPQTSLANIEVSRPCIFLGSLIVS